MDEYEATKIVFERIQNLDPQNASKIMGFLLIQDHGEKEMIRLAFGSEPAVQAVILRVKKELGLVSPNTPLIPSTPPSNPNPRRFESLNSLNLYHNSSNSVCSWTNSSSNFADFQIPDDLLSPTASHPSAVRGAGSGSGAPLCGNEENDLIDHLRLQDQLSFLNPQVGGKTSDLKFYNHRRQDLEALSPAGNDAVFLPSYSTGGVHRRSCSVSDDDLSLGFGWKPCLFYARGYCKNGTTCRFLHGGGGDLAAEGAACNSDYSATNFLQQIPSESPRSLLMDGMRKFSEFGINGVNNTGSRQIYLTFPADSTFREEDVSHYFSKFGPVQDVRIPYQQKRMFGFVTFDYTETVKLILAKGNPHFVCDARVLVKPYKEKGKIPDKHRKQQQHMETGEIEFARCGSPTGMETRDPYDLQIGARIYHNTQDVLWRRKLEDEADLQQAIVLQNRRLMNLRLIDIKRNNHHRALSTGAVISSPTTMYSPTFFNQNAVARMSLETKEGNGSIGKDKDFFNKNESNSYSGEEITAKESGLHKRFDHNLPDSPFASPKAVGSYATAATAFVSDDSLEMEKHGGVSTSSTNNNLIAGASLFPLTSCYLQAPRFVSGHETVEM